jgi:hypothetical protein
MIKNKKVIKKRKNIHSTKKSIKDISTKQLNLKLSNKLMNEIDLYLNEFGYNNAQELIREAIRDKIYGSDNVRTEYLEKLFTDKDFYTSIGEKQSLIELEKLKKRIFDD